MCQYRIYDRNRDPIADSRLLVSEFGCDGKRHAVRQTELILGRKSQVLHVIPAGINITGACDGSCQGKQILGLFEYAPVIFPSQLPQPEPVELSSSESEDFCYGWG
jgi:hypothetical protein